MKTKKTKICVKCEERKPLNEFYHTEKYEDKRSIWCKKCIDEITKENAVKRINENITRLHYTITIRDVEDTLLVIGRLPCGDLYFDLDNISVIIPNENINDFVRKFISRWNELEEKEKIKSNKEG